MDEQEKIPTSNEGAEPQVELKDPAVEGSSVFPEESTQNNTNQKMAAASEILAPQKPLEETLNTLKEYQEAPPPEPEKSEVQPETITAETKLTVEEDPDFKGDTPAAQTPPGGSIYSAPEYDNKDYGSQQFLKDLFSNGNECVTGSTGSFPVNDETRTMLALFSNGRFFVAEDHKYDGRVLGFEYLAKKRRLQIGAAEYISSETLQEIYNYALQMHNATTISADDETQRQTRMQRDFVTVISRAAINHVSDIHIVVAEHTTVMFRVNGLMQTEMEYNKEWGESFVRAAFASADISDANYAQNEYQAAQKLGRTPLRGSGGRLVLPKNVLGLRLQFNPIAFGSRYVVIRILYSDETPPGEESIKALGYNRHDLDIFRYLRSIPTGIVIVSGPTGSGKSTTLQRNMIAMLQERNYETNLITVEDPPEYPIPGARQMPVTNASVEEAKDREFTKALSAALRSDPDSLMIGEIRTLSAADLAFRGALSGHNVWTTLHANTAAAVLLRLRDIGVENFKLEDPSIMRAMLAQRLFRRLCPHCRIQAKTQLDNPAVQRLREAYGDIGVERAFLRGPGCQECDFHGVNGRTAVAEFVLPDATFLDLMLKGESQKAMNYWITDLGGKTLRENAMERLFKGVLDIEEVERWTGLINQSN